MTKKRIVVVDDEPAIGQLIYEDLTDILGREYHIPVYTDPSKALSFLRMDAKVKLLITDLRMVPIDGYALVRLVRKFSSIPIIIYSGFPDSKKMNELNAELASVGKPPVMVFTKSLGYDVMLEFIKSITIRDDKPGQH